jgi:hypothetical protein
MKASFRVSFLIVLFVPIFGWAQVAILDDICSLSITTATGHSSLCNAVHIGQGRLLTAAHCFPEGQSTAKNGLIIAKCGNDEFMDFLKIDQKPASTLTTNSEDISIARFAPALARPGLRPTTNPAMYFDNSQLKPSAECEILALRNDSLITIRVDASTHLVKVSDSLGYPSKIIHKKRLNQSLSSGTAVRPGDSGGALLCRYTKNKSLELVGITVDVRTLKTNNQPMQNTFSPVFGQEAQRLINK